MKKMKMKRILVSLLILALSMAKMHTVMADALPQYGFVEDSDWLWLTYRDNLLYHRFANTTREDFWINLVSSMVDTYTFGDFSSAPTERLYLELLSQTFAIMDRGTTHIRGDYDDLFSFQSPEEYAYDLAKIGISLLGEKFAGTSDVNDKLIEAMGLAVAVADDAKNWSETFEWVLSNISDYGTYSSVLDSIIRNSTGDLRKAARVADDVLYEVLDLKMDLLEGTVQKNLRENDYGYFSDAILAMIRQTDTFINDESIQFFVNGAGEAVEAISTLFDSYKTGVDIGKFVGNFLANGLDYGEIMVRIQALDDLSYAINDALVEEMGEFYETVYQRNDMDGMRIFYQYLTLLKMQCIVHAEGEQLLQMLLENKSILQLAMDWIFQSDDVNNSVFSFQFDKLDALLQDICTAQYQLNATGFRDESETLDDFLSTQHKGILYCMKPLDYSGEEVLIVTHGYCRECGHGELTFDRHLGVSIELYRNIHGRVTSLGEEIHGRASAGPWYYYDGKLYKSQGKGNVYDVVAIDENAYQIEREDGYLPEYIANDGNLLDWNNPFHEEDGRDGYSNMGDYLDVEEYIIPDSDKRYLTVDDIVSLDAASLRLARNEIYARHGRLFKNQELQDYFNAQSWYRGTMPPDEFDTNYAPIYMSDIEKYNVKLIKGYENGTVNSHNADGNHVFKIEDLAKLPIQEAADRLGFYSCAEVPSPYSSESSIYYFKYNGNIDVKQSVNLSGDIIYEIDGKYSNLYSMIWGVGRDTSYWELYIRDPGYSFYGIEVGMDRMEAERIERDIPYVSSLGYWLVLYENDKVREIHTYYEG